MTNPDRWLQRCAENAMDDDEDDYVEDDAEADAEDADADADAEDV